MYNYTHSVLVYIRLLLLTPTCAVEIITSMYGVNAAFRNSTCTCSYTCIEDMYVHVTTGSKYRYKSVAIKYMYI